MPKVSKFTPQRESDSWDSSKRSQGHVFTVYDYADKLDLLAKIAEKATYMVYGKEVCPDTGRLHLQGYVYFNSKRLSGPMAKKVKCWVRPARGNPEQNKGYCTKDGDYKEFGTLPKQGARNDIHQFVLDCKDTPTVFAEATLLEDYTNIVAKYPAFVARVQRHYNAPVANKTMDNYWYYGPPGTGKTYAAKQHGTSFLKNPNKWFDGYAGQDTVVCEDYEPKHSREMGWFLKIWADLDPFTADVKCSSMFIRPRRIIVTSNYCIDEMGWDKVTTAAMKRRFIEVGKFQEYVFPKEL